MLKEIFYGSCDPRKEDGDTEQSRVAQHMAYMAMHNRAVAMGAFLEGITEEWLRRWEL